MDGAEFMVTSREFMALDRLPRTDRFPSGAVFISFEFAHFAVRLGSTDTRCVVLEAASRPLAPFDEEMVNLLITASAAEGIDIHCNVNITAIEKTDRTFIIVTENGRRFESDLVVHGAGRSPNIDDLDLGQAGIEGSRRGIKVNENMATTNPWGVRHRRLCGYRSTGPGGRCRGPGGGG